jgi:hypothetical protein
MRTAWLRSSLKPSHAARGEVLENLRTVKVAWAVL